MSSEQRVFRNFRQGLLIVILVKMIGARALADISIGALTLDSKFSTLTVSRQRIQLLISFPATIKRIFVDI